MKQPTLFPMPKPDLVMVVDDPSTSNDPLDAFLQRRGWCLNRVSELQASISEKLTVDFLTGDVRKLNAAELQLQADIEDYLCGT